VHSTEVSHAPGMPAFLADLAGQPDHISAVRFLNYEGQPEAVDLVNRFEQVILMQQKASSQG